MPLQYPLAANARAALDSQIGARTVAEARELAQGPVELVSDFLRPGPTEREEVQGKAEAGIARGFVQLYEDAKGNPVIAVSYWKLISATKAKAQSRRPKSLEPRRKTTPTTSISTSPAPRMLQQQNAARSFPTPISSTCLAPTRTRPEAVIPIALTGSCTRQNPERLHQLLAPGVQGLDAI